MPRSDTAPAMTVLSVVAIVVLTSTLAKGPVVLVTGDPILIEGDFG